MYRRFSFEGDVHVTLDCVPLTVRRKLDVAARKISLAGWQALPRADRLALCHLPVDTEEDVAVYGEVFEAFAARAAVPLSPLPPADRRSWAPGSIPAPVADRLATAGWTGDLARWAGLTEEERYAIVKYADPKRDGVKLRLLLAELGLLDRARYR